jgi:hypothetical protein
MARQRTGAQLHDVVAPDRWARSRHRYDLAGAAPQPAFDAEQIHRILREGSLGERQALVDQLPPHPLKSTVRLLMDSSSACTPIAALAALASEYCQGRDPAVGAPLAAALYARGAEIVRTESNQDLLSITLARLALAHFKALSRLRRHGTAVVDIRAQGGASPPDGRPPR